MNDIPATDEHGYPLPGPGRVCDELRGVSQHTICHYCGKMAAPQTMRVHFRSYQNWYTREWAWRVAFFTHPTCEPA